MRGRTLNDSFVILDEAQNTTAEQMKMFLTRLGFGSKAVVTGDVTQIDLPTGRVSGLVEAMKVVSAGGGHRVRPLRRSRRRAPQARAADRQGVRGVPVGQRPANLLNVMPADGQRPSRLAVSVVDGQGEPFRAPGLGRWLTRVAPARARAR